MNWESRGEGNCWTRGERGCAQLCTRSSTQQAPLKGNGVGECGRQPSVSAYFRWPIELCRSKQKTADRLLRCWEGKAGVQRRRPVESKWGRRTCTREREETSHPDAIPPERATAPHHRLSQDRGHTLFTPTTHRREIADACRHSFLSSTKFGKPKRFSVSRGRLLRVRGLRPLLPSRLRLTSSNQRPACCDEYVSHRRRSSRCRRLIQSSFLDEILRIRLRNLSLKKEFYKRIVNSSYRA